MQGICIRYTEARAGVLRSALLEEFPFDLVPLLTAIALNLLAPTRGLPEELLEPRLADAHEATFASQIEIGRVPRLSRTS